MTPEQIDLATKTVALVTAVLALLAAVAKPTVSGLSKKRGGVAPSRIWLPWTLLAVFALLVLGSLALNMVNSSDPKAFSRYLATQDGVLFDRSKSGIYDVARVFPDKASIEEDSDLGAVIEGSQMEFSLFSDHAASVLDRYGEQIKDAVRRGVRVRIVLLSPTALKEGKCKEILEASDRDEDFLLTKTEAACSTIEEWQKQLNDAGHRGQLDLHLLEHPVFHRMWLRDPGSKTNAMAHITILQYRGRLTPPSFRATSKSSKKLVTCMADEFEAIWNKSVSLEDEMPEA